VARKGLFNNKAQAAAELALFGSLVLLIFGILLSYAQRYNDQQYVQMEAFRRALQKACVYQSVGSGGAGASVRFNLIQTRRQADLSGSFKKGSSQTLSAVSNVFWGVPGAGKQAHTLTVYKINEDEKEIDYSAYVPSDKDDVWLFQQGPTLSASNTGFNEVNTRQEGPQEIVNTRASRISDTITTIIPYTIVLKDDKSVTVDEGNLLEVEQGLYRDTDGQYKYSQQAVGNVVERGKTWSTGF
jgi:hypothetical protein